MTEQEQQLLAKEVVFNNDHTLNQYQQNALKTAVYPEDLRIVYPALGLNGEAGEVADKVKKVFRDKDGNFDADARRDILAELGDVLWYVAVMANDIGFSLEEVAEYNVKKLALRQATGTLHGSGDYREKAVPNEAWPPALREKK